jgi:hypothetical protein
MEGKIVEVWRNKALPDRRIFPAGAKLENLPLHLRPRPKKKSGYHTKERSGLISGIGAAKRLKF